MKLEMNKGLKFMVGFLAGFTLLGSLAIAEEVKVGVDNKFVGLTADKPYIYVIHDGSSVKVQRVQDPNYELSGYFAKTIRPCPPHCLKPISPSPDVETYGEVEMFDFMEHQLRDGSGVLIDARTPSWYKKGTIPGSVNIPFTLFNKEPDSPEVAELLEKFGAKERGDVGFFTSLLEKWGIIDTKYKTEDWDFTGAKDLVLYCNGPDCGQSPRAIRGLLATHYPADKVKYYRGGMRMWEFWGLTTIIPSAAKEQ
ncbi:rhodanese-like domain-containing protein [Thiolapillus brandeum]|uniref:Rhodanese domain protein n=1 Tax=Thiolapillus brandeum TaxID=1076588 RepID=A0A7U6GKT6_9GAMM|nr:rhodanese-like domain-containing protein [Thiolapillus brandeum]BAO45497.1 rhodanese domain protein [Thiolapillus brandeum]